MRFVTLSLVLLAACNDDASNPGGGGGAVGGFGGTTETGGASNGGEAQGGKGEGGALEGGASEGGSSEGGRAEGGGGGGVTCTPESSFSGPPLNTAVDAWEWVDVPGATCRDGSQTGFGIRRSSASDHVVIYLEGGGACFNNESCIHNPPTFGSTDFASWSGGRNGIFDPANEANPFAQDSMIYVPYCTGDVHAGDATMVDVPGLLSPQDQSFIGYANMGLFLEKIVPTFSGASRVVLTGSSAGGFGALMNYDRVAQAFCPSTVILIDDSGPPLHDETMAPCLQTRWRSLYAMNDTLPEGCTGCVSQEDGGGLVSAFAFLGEKYPDAPLGLISYDQDAVISLFFGFGRNQCLTIDAAPVPITGPEYAAALARVREEELEPTSAWGSYFIPGALHTVLGGDAFYSTEVGGVKLTDWVGALVANQPRSHVGP